MTNLKFLLISDPRSGTMMLTDALNELPCVSFYNLYASNPNDPQAHHKNWEKFQRETSPGVTHKGTTMHRVGDGWINKLSPRSPETFWRVVAGNHDKYLCLHRDNLLRRFLSKKVGVILRSYGVHTPRTKDPGPVNISVQELMEFIGNTKILRDKIDQQFSGKLVVVYENLAANWKNEFSRVLEYLELPDTQVAPVTFCQETRPLAESIQNYEEISSYLSYQDLGDWLH